MMLALALGACGDDAAVDVTPDAAPDSTPEPISTEVMLSLHDRGAATASNATMVVFQDGDGAWQAVAGTDGTYRATTRTGRFGFQTVCHFIEGERVQRVVRYQTIADGTTVNLESCARPAPSAVTREIAGTVRGITTESVEVASALDRAFPDDGGTYQLDVPEVASNLLLISTDDFDTYRYARRALEAGAADRLEDFVLADSLVGERALVDVPGVAPDDVSFFSFYDLVVPEGRIFMPFDSADEPRVFALPAELRRQDDRYDLYVSAEEAADESGVFASRDSYRSAASTFTVAALPARPTWQPPTKDSAPSVPFAWALTGNVPPGVTAVAASAGNFFGVRATVDATPGWAAGATTNQIENPSGVPGWDATWNLDSSSSWNVGTYTVAGSDLTGSTLNGSGTSTSRHVQQATRLPGSEQRARLHQRLTR